MIRFTLVCLAVTALVISAKLTTTKIPFIINEKGHMWLLVSGMNYSLNKNLTLKIKDAICTTKIDFSRPNEKEKKAKKGIRTMIVSCKDELLKKELAKDKKKPEKSSKKN
uniref:Uncharacterized protein n=1 Tax=Trichobilharzia regenti TaxID=157069 RepID=A0AA85KJS1_TRIRE|nr:unnamed protein product [Trichobilharzia regenti]